LLRAGFKYDKFNNIYPYNIGSFREFSDQFRLTSPPYFIRRILFLFLAPIGKMGGYRAVYPEYSGVDS